MRLIYQSSGERDNYSQGEITLEKTATFIVKADSALKVIHYLATPLCTRCACGLLLWTWRSSPGHPGEERLENGHPVSFRDFNMLLASTLSLNFIIQMLCSHLYLQHCICYSTKERRRWTHHYCTKSSPAC